MPARSQLVIAGAIAGVLLLHACPAVVSPTTISQDTGAVVSNQGPKTVTRTFANFKGKVLVGTAPLPAASVLLVDARLRQAPNTPVNTTDGDGKFGFVAVSSQVWLVTAKGNSSQLAGVVLPSKGDSEVLLSAASTLAVAGILTLTNPEVDGAVQPIHELADLSVARFQDLVAAIDRAATTVDLGKDVKRQIAPFMALTASNPDVKAAFDAIIADLRTKSSMRALGRLLPPVGDPVTTASQPTATPTVGPFAQTTPFSATPTPNGTGSPVAATPTPGGTLVSPIPSPRTFTPLKGSIAEVTALLDGQPVGIAAGSFGVQLAAIGTPLGAILAIPDGGRILTVDTIPGSSKFKAIDLKGLLGKNSVDFTRAIVTQGTTAYAVGAVDGKYALITLSVGIDTRFTGTAKPLSGVPISSVAGLAYHVATDTFYIADESANDLKSFKGADGVVTVYAGKATVGTMPTTTKTTVASAVFNGPAGLALEGKYLYVADSNNHTIYRANLDTNEFEWVTGGVPGFTNGSLANSAFKVPKGLFAAGDGFLLCEISNQALRRIRVTADEVLSFTRDATTGSGLVSAPRGIGQLGNEIYTINVSGKIFKFTPAP